MTTTQSTVPKRVLVVLIGFATGGRLGTMCGRGRRGKRPPAKRNQPTTALMRFSLTSRAAEFRPWALALIPIPRLIAVAEGVIVFRPAKMWVDRYHSAVRIPLVDRRLLNA